MADVFKLTQSDVQAAAKMFETASEQTGTLIKDLQTKVDSLSSGWEGDSYNAFVNMFSDVAKNLQSVVELYEGMNQTLLGTAEATAELDSTLASNLSSAAG
ncbi:hypothetical protein AGMMS49992_18090 [Clostridia bacterium]|nr:hypothetical protein AGMMS49992_18090 [Clostridia bacterium]